MFPATTQHRGPVQHPSDSTAAVPGPPARAAKNYDSTVTNGPNSPSTRDDTTNPFKALHTWKSHLHEQSFSRLGYELNFSKSALSGPAKRYQ